MRATGNAADALTTVCPPGSVQEYMLADFNSHSMISLPLAFWTLFSLTGQFLCAKNACVVLPDGAKVHPTLYTLLLADSGACKTWVYNKIMAGFRGVELNQIVSPKSPEGLLVQLSTFSKAGKAANWCKDEAGNWWQAIRSDVGNGGLYKDILLTAFTQGDISSQLKTSSYDVKAPRLSFFGLSQRKLFNTHFCPDDWLSGLMQRMTLAVCEPRVGVEDRLRLDKVAVKLEEKTLPMLRELVQKSTIHQEYTLSETCIEYLAQSVAGLAKTHVVDTGFSLRAFYNSYKYALIFHFLGGNTSSQIGLESCKLAINLVTMSFIDLKVLIDSTERSELADIVDKAYAKRLDCYTGKCKKAWTRTHLIQSVRMGNQDVDLVLEIVEEEFMHEMRNGALAKLQPYVLPVSTPIVKAPNWEKLEAKELKATPPVVVPEVPLAPVVPMELPTVPAIEELPCIPTRDEIELPDMPTDEEDDPFNPGYAQRQRALKEVAIQRAKESEQKANKDGILAALSRQRWQKL